MPQQNKEMLNINKQNVIKLKKQNDKVVNGINIFSAVNEWRVTYIKITLPSNCFCGLNLYF